MTEMDSNSKAVIGNQDRQENLRKMLRRNTRRRRSRTRTEITIETVIEVWKSEAFQEEHGESKEKIEKIIQKWKKNALEGMSKEKSIRCIPGSVDGVDHEDVCSSEDQRQSLKVKELSFEVKALSMLFENDNDEEV